MSKFSKKFKRQLKKAGRAVDKVVSMPVRVVRATVEGKSSTTILKEVGRGIGGAAQLSLITSGDGQKILGGDKLNKVTFGITKELRNVGQGFNAMSKRETVDSSFYKSALSLGAKAAVGYGAYSYFAAAPAASGGAIEVTSQTAVAGSNAATAGAVTSTNVATGAGIKGAALTAGKYATYGVLAKKILSGDAKLADVAESFIPGSGELFGGDGSDKDKNVVSPTDSQGYDQSQRPSNTPMLLALGAVGLFVLAKK